MSEIEAEGYSGASNLEVMTAAVNYNAFLERMVINASGGADTALDFGAGGGEFARRVSARGLDVTCLEPDDALRRALSEAGFDTHDRLEAIQDSRLPFIYTLNVLEHIEDDAAALAGLYAKLQPGGTLFIYVPAFNVLYGAMDRLVGHYRRYRLEGLRARVSEAGFEIADSGYADPLGFFAAYAHKLIGSDSGRISDTSVKAFDRLVFPISRALHPVTRGWIGKNVWVRAVKTP